jgi:hypothetical protein
MQGELQQFYMFPHSHGNFILFTKRERSKEIKGELFAKGRFQYSCILLRFGNTLEVMPLGAPPCGENALYRNLPYNIYIY